MHFNARALSSGPPPQKQNALLCLADLVSVLAGSHSPAVEGPALECALSTLLRKAAFRAVNAGQTPGRSCKKESLLGGVAARGLRRVAERAYRLPAPTGAGASAEGGSLARFLTATARLLLRKGSECADDGIQESTLSFLALLLAGPKGGSAGSGSGQDDDSVTPQAAGVIEAATARGRLAAPADVPPEIISLLAKGVGQILAREPAPGTSNPLFARAHQVAHLLLAP